MNHKPFLTASWTNLINLTYAVDPSLLLPYLPKGTKLDMINGQAFVSLVPFDFTNTRFLSMRLPYHTDFPEINLRFYVSHKEKKGVVFLKEFIPRYFIKAIANTFYNERYECVRLKSYNMTANNELKVSHELKMGRKVFKVEVIASNECYVPVADSTEHYFEERFYGFSQTSRGEPLMFHVEHPSWELYPVKNFKIDFDFGFLFGGQWSFLNEAKPVCAMLVKGSEVKMFPHRKLESVFERTQPAKAVTT